MNILEEIEKLEGAIRKYQPLIVALSGGIDSSLLAFAAKRALGNRMMTLSVDSPFSIRKEIDFAAMFASGYDIRHEIIKLNPLYMDEITRNDSMRCYYCKRLIFTKINEFAKDENFSYVADGTNLDDDTDYRPGSKALKELGIISPLQMSGFTKEMILEACSHYNIKIPFHSNACIATRIPYGAIITEHALGMIQNGEQFLEELGFYPVRLRYHSPLARLELTPADSGRLLGDESLRIRVVAKLKELGFKFITLDVEGFRSGSMDLLI